MNYNFARVISTRPTAEARYVRDWKGQIERNQFARLAQSADLSPFACVCAHGYVFDWLIAISARLASHRLRYCRMSMPVLCKRNDDGTRGRARDRIKSTSLAFGENWFPRRHTATYQNIRN